MALDLNSPNIQYENNKVIIKALPKEGENLSVFVRPGDEVVFELDGIDTDELQYLLVGGDIVISFAGEGALTFASLGLMGFSGNPPIFNFGSGKIISVDNILSKIESVNELPIESVNASFMLRVNEVDEETGLMNEKEDSSDVSVIVIPQTQIDEQEEIKEEDFTAMYNDQAEDEKAAIAEDIDTSSETSSITSAGISDVSDAAQASLKFSMGFYQTNYETNEAFTEILGGGGSQLANISTSPAAQIEPETIDLRDDYNNIEIYADNSEYFGNDGEYITRVVRITPEQPEGFGVTQIDISGLLEDFEIIGASSTSLSEDNGFSIVEIDGVSAVEFLIKYPSDTDFDTFSITVKITSEFSIDNLEEGASIATPDLTMLTEENTFNIEVKETITASDYVYSSQNGEVGYVLNSNLNSNIIYTSQGDSTVHGGSTTDSIYGQAGDDIISGNSGNDTLSGGAGINTLDGGDDLDTLSYEFIDRFELPEVLSLKGDYNLSDAELSQLANSIDTGITINLADGTASGSTANEEFYTAIINNGSYSTTDENGDSITYSRLMLDFEDEFSNIENIDATNYNDTIYGDENNNVLSGLAGSDFIYGNAGDDSLFGGVGDDYLEGGEDTGDISGVTLDVSNISQAKISFGDLITAYGDYIDGGAGDDKIGFDNLTSSSTDGVSVFLDTYGEDGDSNGIGIAYGADTGMGVDLIVNIENVLGSNYDDTLVGNDSANSLSGNSGNDYINGAAGDDSLYGNIGNDIINGGLGDNYIDGGSGVDTVEFSDSNLEYVVVDLDSSTGKKYTNSNVLLGTDTLVDIEIVQGTDGDDTLLGNALNNTFYGGEGNDTINGRGGENYLDGGTNSDGATENDWVSYSSKATVDLSNETATVSGDTSTIVNIENIEGSAYGDTLTGSSVSNTILGESGNDTISGNDGDNVLDGGDGTDTLSYSYYASLDATTGLSIDMSDGNVIHDTYEDLVTNFENLIGTEYNDNLTGTTGINTISAGAGNDTVYATAGNDSYNGGSGINVLDYSSSFGSIEADLLDKKIIGTETGTDIISNFIHLIGSGGDDEISGDNNNNILDGSGGDDIIDGVGGNNTLIAGSGIDTLIASAGADTYDGTGTGDDTVDYSSLSTAINIVLNSTGDATVNAGYTHTLTEIEHITGTTDNDIIVGDSTNINTIDGYNGNDILEGGMNSADVLIGGSGDDTFYGSSGGDSIYGGIGTDTLDYSSITGTAGVELDLSQSAIYSDGFASVNAHVESIEIIQGSASDDTISGSGLSETFYANKGNDTLKGSGGVDTLYGVEGNNTLYGGDGTDTLYAGIGNDTLIGGDGADTLDARDYDGDDALTTGGGNNTFIGGLGNDTYYGGIGIDTLDYTSSETAITVEEDNNIITSSLDGVDDTDTLATSFEVLEATNYADTIYLEDGYLAGSTIYANGGNDTIYASASSGDIIYGGNANDTIYANGGNNIYYGGDGVNIQGDDILDYSLATSGINVDLESNVASDNGFSGSDEIYHINNIIGSDEDDTIKGNSEDNTISSGEGDDTLYLSSGQDVLDGGTNSDGSSENDWLSLEGMSSSVSDLKLNSNDAGDSKVYNIENVIDYDGDRSQTVRGSSSDNIFVMYGGNDYVIGYGGNDTYDMGSGNDYIYANNGSDIIIGGSGTDNLNYNDNVGENQASTIILQNLDTDNDGNDDYVASIVTKQVTDIASLEDNIDYNFFEVTDGQGNTDYIYREDDGTSDIESFTLTDYADLFVGDDGANYVSGRNGADTIYGMGGNDIINSGDSADLVYGGGGNDSINGGNGADIVYGEDGADTINGDSGDDNLYGGDGADNISGGENNDTIWGGIGNDTLSGDNGDDTIYNEDGTDTIDGGAGIDTLIFSDDSAGINVNLNLETGTDAFGNSETITNIEHVTGTSDDDTITGSNTINNTLYGLAGNDTFYITTGNDYIDGGDNGDDDYGDTVILSSDIDGTVRDTNTDLLISPEEDTNYDNTVDMLSDHNVEYKSDDTSYSSKIYDIENIEGSDLDDYVKGTITANVINTGSGNDYVQGLGGNDIIDLGDGNDIVEGGEGDDTLTGGEGEDTLVYSSSTTGVTVDLSSTTVTNAETGTDTISGFENIVASNSGDTLTGSSDANIIYALSGDDTVIASTNSDTLYGGDGADTADYSSITEELTVTINGSNDITISGSTTGTDTLNSFESIVGGTGADTFTVTSVEGITTLDGGTGAGINSLVLSGELDLSDVTLLNFNTLTIVDDDVTINATDLSAKTIEIKFTGTGNLTITSDDSSHNFSNISVTGSGEITLDVNDTKDFTNTDLNDIIDFYDVSGDITLLESQAIGTLISGSGSATVEVSENSSTAFSTILASDIDSNTTIEFTADSTFDGDFGDSNILVDSGVTLTTTFSKLNAKTDSLSGDGDIILTDSSVSANNVNDVLGAIDGDVTATIDATSTTVSALNTALSNATTGTDALTIVLDTTSTSASELNALDAKTSVNIDATSITDITSSSVSEVETLIANKTSAGIDSDWNVVISDATLSAADVDTINDATSGQIDISAATIIDGTSADILKIVNNTDATFITASDYATTLSDTTVSVINVNTIANDTTGVVTATVASGTAEYLNNNLTDTDVNALTLTVTGTTASATDLNELDTKTSVDITLNATEVTGEYSDLYTLYIDNKDNFINLGDEEVVISDEQIASNINNILEATSQIVSASVSSNTASNLNGALTEASATDKLQLSVTGSATASDLMALDLKTALEVDATSVTSITGTLSQLTSLNTAINAGTIDIGDDVVIAITDADDESLAASDLSTIGSMTNGTVTVNNAVNISGTQTAVVAALLTASSLVVAASANVEITDSASVTNVNSIDALTSGEITASISDSVDNLKTLTGEHAYTITISDTAATTTELNTINNATSETVTLSSTGNFTVTMDTVTLDLSNFTNDVDGDLIINDTSGNDTITGTDGNDIVNLTDGNDSVTLGNGDDTVNIAADNLTSDDTIVGGEGTDTLNITDNASDFNSSDFSNVSDIENLNFSDALDSITFTDSSDFATWKSKFSSVDFGDSNDDTINFDSTSISGDLDFSNVADIENLNLSSGSDDITLSGDEATNIDGLGGDDTFTLNFSNISNFTIDGGSGSDTLSITNYDTQTLSGSFENFETLNLSASGTVTIDTATIDSWTSENDFTITSSNGSDTLTLSTDDVNYSISNANDNSTWNESISIDVNTANTYYIDTDGNTSTTDDQLILHVV